VDGEDCDHKAMIKVLLDKHGNEQIHEHVLELLHEHGNQQVHVVRSGGGRYRLGVALEPVGAALRAHLGIDDEVGLMVSQVLDDTPAEEIGLQRFDVLVGIAGDKINSGDQSSLVEAIEEAGEAGDRLRITFMRGGKRMNKRFTPQKAQSSSDKESVRVWIHEDDDDDHGDDDDDDGDDDDEDGDDDDDGDDHADARAARAKARAMADRARREAARARGRYEGDREAARARGRYEGGGRYEGDREAVERARHEAAMARKQVRVRVERSRNSVDSMKKEIQELRAAIEEIKEALREGDDD
jgi:hypothetical protein